MDGVTFNLFIFNTFPLWSHCSHPYLERPALFNFCYVNLARKLPTDPWHYVALSLYAIIEHNVQSF